MTLHPDIAAVLAGVSEGCIVNGDCLEIMADMPDGCVDVVVTDPPYPKEYSHVWGHLGTSYRIVKDGGFLATMCGHYHMMLVLDAIRAEGWRFFWPCIAPNNNQPIMHGFRAKCCHKPFPVFVKGKGLPQRIFCDNFGLRMKTSQWQLSQRLHKWGQDEGLFYEPIDAFSAPGEIVMDPFCGGGTTCAVAKRTGRRWIGIDIDEGYCQTARNRLMDTERPLFPPTKEPER